MTQKLWIALLVLLIKATSIYACGPFYPHGEDLRFSLFSSEIYGFQEFDSFYYSANSFYLPSNSDNTRLGQCENVELWELRCSGQVLEDDIMEAVHKSSFAITKKDTTNSFVNYLLKNDLPAYDYLKFAWSCSSTSQYIMDPWERNYKGQIFRNKAIKESLKKARISTDEKLAKRYAFLAIRDAHYDNNSDFVNDIYDEFFTPDSENTIIKRWATFFKALAHRDKKERLIYASETFKDTPDKRFRIYQVFKPQNGWKSALDIAKTDDEKEALWLLEGINKHSYSTEPIKELLKLNPNSSSLKFLVQREINKLEDWILGPYFTEFQPSLYRLKGQEIWHWAVDPHPYTSKNISNQVKKDRLHAVSLLNLLNDYDAFKEYHTDYGLSIKANLLYLSGQDKQCVDFIDEVLANYTFQPKAKRQLQTIYFLAKQKAQPPFSNEEYKVLYDLLKREYSKGNTNFVFSIARESEFQGETTLAALLYSFVTNDHIHSRRSISWKSKNRESIIWKDNYYDYNDYLDAHYSAKDISNLLDIISSNNKHFPAWMYEHVTNDKALIQNLLGTKHLRQDNLEKALESFSLVNDSIWHQYPYSEYLDANPFFTTLSGGREASDADTVTFTKPEIIKKLISLKKSGNISSNPNQARDLIEMANCYFNMTFHGNSWIMSRSYWSVNHIEHGLDDDPNYFGAVKARDYYLKAKESTNDEKIKALCLYMAAKCEKFHIRFTSESKNYETITENKYFNQFKSKYEDSLEEFSTCESFTFYLSEVLKK